MLGQPSPSQEVVGPAKEVKKTPISFCQLDGSIAGGVPATLATEPLGMSKGSHSETPTFIVAPGMEWSLVPGLAWLKKMGHLKFPGEKAPLPTMSAGKREETWEVAVTLSSET